MHRITEARRRAAFAKRCRLQAERWESYHGHKDRAYWRSIARQARLLITFCNSLRVRRYETA